jgi:adhesin HecA-like repeat protein
MWERNAENQHLMHKVQDYLLIIALQVGTVNNSGGVKKGQDRVKLNSLQKLRTPHH